MPAEWAPHDACWMLWPTRPDTWRRGARPAQDQWLAVIEAIASSEPVRVGVDPNQLDEVAAHLPRGAVAVAMDSDDAWMRDVGPTILLDGDGGRLGVDWEFNAWGGIYEPYDSDQRVAAAVLAHEGIERAGAGFVLEGGSIHVDGQGTCLTTEQCLLHLGRNPDLDRDRLDSLLRSFLGCELVVWLGEGVHQDETAGHVDNLACFSAPGVVLVTTTEDRDDPQYVISADAIDRLRRAVDARGAELEIRSLPSPGPLYMTEAEAAGLAPGTSVERLSGRRLAGSYVNFYLANGAVIAPLLDERTDDRALELLEASFPGRRVVGVPAREILLGGGNIHCITQQVPAARSS